MNTIVNLIPTVLRELEKEGYETLLQDFIKLVAKKKFPLRNIALRLWADVQWCGLSDTRLMRYSTETIQFFWLGKELFGGKFIRFMSGLKNETDILVGQKVLDPQQSKINFACPSENILCGINPMGEGFPDVLKPGILNSVIEMKRAQDDNVTSYILMFDSRKVKRGGDVNLLGYEDRPLQERRQVKVNALQTLESAIDISKSMQEKTNEVGETFPEDRN